MGCSALWTRRPDDLRAAFSLVPEYLRVSEEVASLSEYSPALGRQFRALKLWAVLRCYGREGVQERIREAIRLAALFESWVDDEPGWEVVAPRPFSLVCFRRDGSDELNEALLERVNASGEVFISHTKLNGRYVLRLAVGNARTTEDDVRVAWDVLRREAALAGAGANASSSRSSTVGVALDANPFGLAVHDEVVEADRVGLDEHVGVLDDPLDRDSVDERRFLVADPERHRPRRRHRREREVERMHQPARLERLERRRPHQPGAEAGELVQHRPELPARRCQLVDGRRGRRRQLPLLDEAGRLELLEPRGQDVRADPGQLVDEVGVPLRPVHQLAHDEQRPALADEAERARDRGSTGRSACSLLHILHYETCETQVDPVTSQASTPEPQGQLMVASPRLKWFGLALLGAVQFMVVLDIAIVNVALPSIQTDLDFSQANLQWVISAYALVFGGFLLLGGRTADLLGRRRIFMIGLIAFTIGSLLCGLAWSEASLIGARAIQGLGAATISPAALAILMTTFAEGRERNIALGVWGAVGGFGAAAGVLLGGVLTDALSWEWIFFVNIPVGLAAVALAPVLLGGEQGHAGEDVRRARRSPRHRRA